MHHRWLLILLAGLLPLRAAEQESKLTAYDLRCADRSNPSGITGEHPTLSWKLASPVRGDAQTSWRVLAASSPELLGQDQGNLWDSCRVTSPVASGTYRGKNPASGERVYWKVKVTDSKGVDSAWSPIATWVTGIMKPGEWSDAKWITAPLVSTNSSVLPGNGSSSRFRKEIVVKPGLRRAVIHLAGLGQYKLEVNGTDCTPALMTPGWTDPSKTILYDTIDLSDHLKPGTNAIMITLGGGMYRNPPSDRYAKFVTEPRLLKCRGVLDVSYSDGFSEKVRTDGTWHCIPSPITYGSIYGGEDHDARLESEKKLADAPLAFVLSGEMIPSGSLEGAEHAGPAIREIEVMRPVATNALTSNSFVVDLGQNAPIMPRITAHGPAGSAVRITPSELTNSRGEIDDTATHGKSFCTYTLRGEGAETWKPDFYYRGARYLKIDLIPAKGGSRIPSVDSIEGIVVHGSAPSVGRFACSSELFNRIYQLVRWAQRANMMSVLSDCPHREKLGWLEQDHLNGPSLRYNFDLDTLFSKICRDMSDAQTKEGLVPNIAPEFVRFGGGFRDSPEWGSACVLVPWQQYEFTGETTLLGKSYETMKRYTDYLAGRASEGIVDYGLGDWYDVGPKNPGQAQLTPKALTATAFLWQDADILSKTARLLGKAQDAAAYGDLARRTKEAFNAKFFDPVTANYATGSQCANAIPLVMGLVPEEKKPSVLENLVKDVQTKGLTAGDVGYRYLLRALADGGRSDVVYAMNNRKDKPGYAMQLEKGATSLTESWDAGRGSSQNHFMLGQINEWFFHDLAGIQFDPERPGFQHVVIRPTPVGDITWAGADYDSVRGRISSWWRLSAKEFALDVSIPPGCTASVFLPINNPASITESGKPLAAGALRADPAGKDRVKVGIPSGTYHFTCPATQTE
jgi:alpha-L-rhamnosidase